MTRKQNVADVIEYNESFKLSCSDTKYVFQLYASSPIVPFIIDRIGLNDVLSTLRTLRE